MERRSYLLLGAAVVSSGLAGCLEDALGGGDDENGIESDSGRNDSSDGSDDGDRTLNPVNPVELVVPTVEPRDGFVRSDELVANVHGHNGDAHWHQAPLEVAPREERTVRVRFLDEERSEFPIADDDRYRLRASVSEATPDGLLDLEVDGDFLTVRGRERGQGGITVALVEEGELLWESVPIEVVVGVGDSDGE